MSRKIYLSTYILELRKFATKDLVNLTALPHDKTFHQLMEEFILSIAENPYIKSEVQDSEKKTATIRRKSLKMETPLIIKSDIEQGSIYGVMRSGMANGRKLPVDDTNTGEFAYDMPGHYARMFPIYFHLQTFSNRKYAFLILERQGEFGIKQLFESAFAEFLIKKNLKYILQVTNFLVGRIFDKMLLNSKINEVAFIRNFIPDDIAKFYDKGHNKVVGSTKTIYKPGRGYGLPLRDLASKLFRRVRTNNSNAQDHMVRVEGVSEPFDEIDFELETNGTKKTIHMANTGRSLPDYDVSDNVEFENGEPTLESLNREANILLNDMTEFYTPKKI